MPTTEQIRQAIEKSVHDGLATGNGDWFTTTDDKEIQFRPNEKGEIAVFLENDDQETTLRFRVRVELVQE